MTYLENADYFVRLVDLPIGVNGMVSPNDDGTFSVYLSSRNDSEKQLDCYFHEIAHIENDDFYSEKSIDEIEKL